ncbi:hypothetical protein GW17_00013258, partial [Ensete ventricosum]
LPANQHTDRPLSSGISLATTRLGEGRKKRVFEKEGEASKKREQQRVKERSVEKEDRGVTDAPSPVSI